MSVKKIGSVYLKIVCVCGCVSVCVWVHVRWHVCVYTDVFESMHVFESMLL